MLLLKPDKNEPKKDFLTRCISILANEDNGKRWPNNEQRVAICFKIWNENIYEDKNFAIIFKYLH